MLVPLSWLKDYINIDLNYRELANTLTMIGFEVEEIKEEEGEIIFSLKVTSNRGDCLSLLGVAKELSAVYKKKIKFPEIKFKEEEIPISSLIKIEIMDKISCPRYSAMLIKNVKISNSPLWLQKRLKNAGLRSINNVVDATNYVMLEIGQPLHAFDYSLIEGRKIIVRKANDGEKIITLDGTERELTSSDLIIADIQKPIAIAGVMGGMNTEVSESTNTILLESAHFDFISIRKTAKRLKLSTEASYRFERFVDPEKTIFALKRVSSLIQDITDAKICKGIIDIYPKKFKEKKIFLLPERCNFILGTNLKNNQIKEILKSLNLEVKEKNKKFEVKIPTSRNDLNIEVDLIEEIARIYGYEKIKETLPAGKTLAGGQIEILEFEDKIKNIMTSFGLDEVITHSLTSEELYKKCNLEFEDFIHIRNYLTIDTSVLRRSIIPHLLEVASYNFAHQIDSILIFEVGKIYKEENGNFLEKKFLSGLLSGNLWERGWNIPKELEKINFFYTKGILEKLFSKLKIFPKSENNNLQIFSPEKGVSFKINGEEIGIFGEIDSSVQKNFEIKEKVYVFEISLEKLFYFWEQEKKYKLIPKYPKVRRDIAIVVDEKIRNLEIEETIKEAGGEILKDISLFDFYKGPQIKPNCKSLAYSLTFQKEGATLVEEEVNSSISKIIENLKVRYNAELR
jgi:phenylalanyl-tRNA synthetase beta chain